MSIENPDREQLKNLRMGIAQCASPMHSEVNPMDSPQHLEDAATLFQCLPPEEHDLYLTNAIGGVRLSPNSDVESMRFNTAWTLVANEPLSSEKLQRMIETMFAGEDDEEPISGTGGVAA